ncbi:hypothetical protein ACFVP0_24220 [Streptomyces cinereoruber]|uniref:hypothetical protein n=1 Tax=Streptomyces cinereoruber TaxID=67260 RepID=UPI00369A066C
MTRRTAALLLAAGLALTGCSTDPADDPKKPDPAAQALAVALDYQQAANRLDWHTACRLSTAAKRRGTVQECADRYVVPTPEPTPSSSASSLSPMHPPTYADGSPVRTLTPRTPSGPERAQTGPVTAQGAPVTVPAVGEHPAGYGVLLAYQVIWPAETTTARVALRVVAEGEDWRVDEFEDVEDGDMASGDPIRSALGG